MSDLSPKDAFELARSYKDAAAKVAGLPARLEEEFAKAEAENREPFEIQPLTGIRGKLVVYAIDQIVGEVTPELGEIIAAQRRSCSLHSKQVVYLHSDQLKMILDRAGLGEKEAPKADAQVQGQ